VNCRLPASYSISYIANTSLYHQFYSNSDLMKFLSLSGLPNATIPVENVYGDLANDQNEPGGEAQLDVEYIMVRGAL
jgi:subtilase family serine protease